MFAVAYHDIFISRRNTSLELSDHATATLDHHQRTALQFLEDSPTHHYIYFSADSALSLRSVNVTISNAQYSTCYSTFLLALHYQRAAASRAAPTLAQSLNYRVDAVNFHDFCNSPFVWQH